MRDWIATLVDLQQRGVPAVIVTVAAVKGSAPRGAGTKMLVSADAVYGTIGGGHLEFTAIDIARKQLGGGEAALLRRFPLGASLGQCCGGVVNLLFEPVAAGAAWVEVLSRLQAQREALVVVTPVHGGAQAGKLFVRRHDVRGTLGALARDETAAALARALLSGGGRARLAGVGAGAGDETRSGDAGVAAPDPSCFFDPVLPVDFNVVLFGAGHVGRALVPILGALPCAVTWVDERDDAFPATVPANVAVVATGAPEAEVDAALQGSHFLVMTHSHALDERLSERILRRADFAYFGLIGSLPKRRQFERRLAARGIAAGLLAAMNCPIGIAGIAGKEPGVIAVAVAAELLQRQAALRANAAAPHQDRIGAGDGAAPRATSSIHDNNEGVDMKAAHG